MGVSRALDQREEIREESPSCVKELSVAPLGASSFVFATGGITVTSGGGAELCSQVAVFSVGLIA